MPILYTKRLTANSRPVPNGARRPPGSPTNRRSAAVYQELERQILSNELKPRERLTEMALAARFQTSRTSVREALRELELRHLVVATPHRGVTVREFTRTEIEDVYAVRAVVEEMAARLAARKASSREIDEIERWAHRFEAACRKKQLAAMVATNRGFHECLARAGRNRVLVETVDDLCRKTFLVRNIFWSDARHVEQSIEAHARMIQALRQRDEEALVTLAMEHINMGREYYLALLGTI